jgi:hypothetical protein
MTSHGFRVTMTTKHGKRIATDAMWPTTKGAQAFADETNWYHEHARARVVKDSPRIQKMIP